MESKEIIFQDADDKRFKSGLHKAAKAVKSTLGARGRTVLIESERHTAGITATKDGVTVMRAINFEDNVENLAVRLLRQAASRTVTQAGDGTTTATVLTEAIVDSADEVLTPHNNFTEVARQLEIISENVVKTLKQKSRKVSSSKEIYDVATVSANNDPVLGKVISDAYNRVGADGIVTVEKSKNHETYFEVTEGIRFDRGLISPFHITNPRIQACELENPMILITDLKIPSAKSIEHLLMAAIENQRPIVIIGELEMEAMQTFNKNVYEGNLKGCFVQPPSFGDRKSEMMSDMAIAVGADFVTEKTGNDWSSVKISALGSAEKVIVTREETSIIPGKNVSEDDKVETASRIKSLKDQLKDEKDHMERESLTERIANLSGSVATVYVGAKTDVEQKEKRDRVEDSVLATKAAIEDGILPGGGVALLNVFGPHVGDGDSLFKSLLRLVTGKRAPISDEEAALQIMWMALEVPFRQILINAGKDPDAILSITRAEEGYGFNVKSETYGDMIDMGIIDPTKIVVSALSNATSAATTIMMTSAIITNVQK